MRKTFGVVFLILAIVLTVCGCELSGESGTPMLKINGTEITQFHIIYPAKTEDDFAKSVAKDLGKRLSEKYGYECVVVTDTEEPVVHEILIGATNRDVSAYVIEYEAVDEYSISSDGAHIAVTAGGHIVYKLQ